jgi:hypothetical protein
LDGGPQYATPLRMHAGEVEVLKQVARMASA